MRGGEGGTVLDSRSRLPLDALSPYQLRVLRLMAEGRSNAAIADQLGVSRRAVENQVSRLMQALGLGRADDAVAARVCAVLIYLAGRETAEAEEEEDEPV
jgi:DNA-binding NarL/FixJ family response regulator